MILMNVYIFKCLRRFHEYSHFFLKLHLNLIGILVYIYNPSMLSLLKELYECCHFAETNPNPVCRKCQDAKSTLQREVTSMC